MNKIICFVLCATLFSTAIARDRVFVNLPKPNFPFSDGIRVGNTLYIAGEDGFDVHGKLVPGGVVPETKMALEKIGEVLHKAHFQKSDIVSTTVYLSNIADFAKMNAVYATYFKKDFPVRVTIQVAKLVGNAHVEISAIAQK